MCLALVGGSLPPVGQGFPLVGDPVAFIGNAIAFVGDPLPLVGPARSHVGERLRVLCPGICVAGCGWSLAAGAGLRSGVRVHVSSMRPCRARYTPTFGA